VLTIVAVVAAAAHEQCRVLRAAQHGRVKRMQPASRSDEGRRRSLQAQSHRWSSGT
jgi:hypothetical protein